MPNKLIPAVVLLLLLFLSRMVPAQELKEFEISLTKGQYEIELKHYDAAIDYLNQALKLKPGDAAALTSLGIAYARSGGLQQARDVLTKAVDAAPSAARPRYELALVLSELKQQEEAKRQMAVVLKTSTDEDLTAAAQAFLAGGPTARKGKPLSLTLGAGFQYDSNVILDPENPVVHGRKKADWAFLASLGGNYRFLDTGKTSADAGYSFYQSLHNTLPDFNIQQHAFTAGITSDMSEKSRLDLHYTFTYTFVGGDHYSTLHELKPSWAVSLSDASVTEFFYSYDKKKFENSDLFSANSDRSGSNNAGGVTHTIVLDKQSETAIAAGYVYDKDSTDQDFWRYTGNKGSLLARGKVEGVGTVLTASYYDKKYDGLFPGETASRHDKTWEFSLTFKQPLAHDIGLDLSDLYVQNNSNIDLFKYRRNVVTLMAVMRL